MIAAFRKWIKDSETIAWARLQVLLGVVIGTLMALDPNLIGAVLPEKWVPIWFLFSGVVTEVARRRRAKDLE